MNSTDKLSATAHGAPPFRIGQGYDIHALVVDRKLILGGVLIPYEKGLLGHSDADAESQGCDPIAWVQAVSGHATTHEQPQDELYRIDRVEKGSVMAYSRSSIVSLCSSPLSCKWRRLLVQSPSPLPAFSNAAVPPLPPDQHVNASQAAAIALCLAAQDYCLVQQPQPQFTAASRF
jgi:hypothetical protein